MSNILFYRRKQKKWKGLCLVCIQIFFTSSHQIFRHIHEVLNIDEKKLITQFGWKPRDESFKPN
jgi:hypothetical protein